MTEFYYRRETKLIFENMVLYDNREFGEDEIAGFPLEYFADLLGDRYLSDEWFEIID